MTRMKNGWTDIKKLLGILIMKIMNRLTEKREIFTGSEWQSYKNNSFNIDLYLIGIDGSILSIESR